MTSVVTAARAGLLALALALCAAVAGLPAQSAPDAGLRPTAHPPLPSLLEEFWLVPAASRAAIGPEVYAELQEGIRRCLEEDFEEALPLVSDPAWQATPLAAYAAFYTGRTQLGLEQYDAARHTFGAILDAQPAGYLAEGALIGAAEAAERLGLPEVALRFYQTAATRRPLQPAAVWLKIGQLALAIGNRPLAADALARVYYEYPLSEEAEQAATEFRSLGPDTLGPGSPATLARDLERAERLYRAARWNEARAAYLALRPLASGDDRALVDVHLAGAETSLRRHRSATSRLAPYVTRATPHQAEARFLYARATRAQGRHREFVTLTRELVRDHPDSPWARAALDALGTHYIIVDEDARAAEAFRELYARAPSGRYAERAAWKAGWWAYRQRSWRDAVSHFERAAESFPRSDYRPAWLYWSGRAREAMGETAVARRRLELAVIDYGSSYYGRLAAGALRRLPGAPAGRVEPETRAPQPAPPLPTELIIRTLMAAELHDPAIAELDYAVQQWGRTPRIEASRALVLHRQGELRRAITTLKRAYPQYLTDAGDELPQDIQKVIYPLDYWSLIRKHAASHNLDPHLVAALIAQESTFDAAARSSANAYGLMQLIPATGRRVGRTIGLRHVTTGSLVDADTNLRLGTAHLAALLKQFGEPYLALAAYNAGEHNVKRWIAERPGLPEDEFIDDMPFPETQNYVRRILGTVVDYRRLYAGNE